MPPLSRITDSHVCPMVIDIVPHLDGPILGPGCLTALIAGLPTACVDDMVTCVGPPDTIVVALPNVLIGRRSVAS
jgi:uncharacterized Zn-binding protein involved in type VI secretion